MLEGLDDDIVAVYVERIEKEDKMKVLKEIENEIKELKNKKPEPKPAEIEEEFKDLDSLGGLTPEEFNAFEEKDHIGWYGRSEYEMAMYEYILSKHNNDCIPLVVEDPNKKFLLGIRLNKNGKLTGNVYNERGFHELKTDFQINNAIKIMKEKCKKRFIAVPLEIPGHLNMLIIDLKDNTAERFEPHGSGYRGRGGGEVLDEKVNETIKNLIENEWKLTYIPPSGICPFKKGFQAIEQDSKKHNEVLIDEYNKYIAKQGGLCALWSYIYLDLRLSNPNKTPKEIFDKALKGGGISPDLLKKWSVIYAKKVLSPISNKVEELIIEEANDLGRIDKTEMKEYLENVNPLKFLHYLSTSRDGKINLSYKKGKKKIKIDNPNNLKKWTLYSSIHIILVRMILNKIMNSSLQIKLK